MQCHYEVLNVAQDADAATIKKAHRKLAIKFHPDKNLNDEDAAEKFRLVQEAYECLSDVAERRWYDEHRDALLKGWSPNAQESGESMVFDVLPFMLAHCYTGYDDNDEKSFYGIYGHVFASLAKEEADGTSSDGSKGHELPREFGNSKTDLKDVASFYQVWESFVSELTFRYVKENGFWKLFFPA
jgi:DnaJ homolog subfamily A member 5